jgi:hypothetical protein
LAGRLRPRPVNALLCRAGCAQSAGRLREAIGGRDVGTGSHRRTTRGGWQSAWRPRW